MVNTKDIIWLSGFLEGEGCFTATHLKAVCPCPTISFCGTDIDVIFRAANILGVMMLPFKPSPKPHWKQVYRVSINGERAASWMMTLFCLMGCRRQIKIEEILRNWRFGVRPYKSGRGHRKRYRNG